MAATRKTLLAAAFHQIYARGFQGTSIDDIVAATTLTKGALFHIFATKQELGYAVVDEVIAEMIRAQWVTPLQNAQDCLGTIADAFEAGAAELVRMPVHYGCPLNNISQEMAAIDAGFKMRTERIFDEWIGATERALERGKKAGIVRRDVACRDAAVLLVTLVEGILSLAKTSQDPQTLYAGGRNIRWMTESLRAKRTK